MERHPIAIIGAGLAGLAASARLVAAGHDVVIFEKSRGLGGRLATRRGEGWAIDHGAPEVSEAPPAFRDWLATHPGAVAAGAGFIGVPAMNDLPRPLAKGATLHTGIEIAQLRRAGAGWALVAVDGQTQDGFGAVLVTCPPRQAAAICAGATDTADLYAVDMAPVWTLLAVFDRPQAQLSPAAPGSALGRAVPMAGRPGRSDAPDGWAFHMTPAFTRRHLEADRARFAPDLLAEVQTALGGALDTPAYLAAHRWRYAYAERPLGRPWTGDPAAGLLMGGDWALGRHAGHAWASGTAMAEALISR